MSGILCSSCGAPIAIENVDRRLAVARCSHCNALTDISGSPLMDAGRGEVPLPPGITLERSGRRLRIVRTWFGWKKLAALAGTLVAPLFLYLFFFREQPPAKFPVQMLWVFLAVLFAGFYAALAGVVNRTSITVANGRIAIRHWPLPWLPMPTLDAADVEQVYCQRREVVRRSSGSRVRSETTAIVYDVLAVTVSGRSASLVRGLDSIEQAEFVEQEIERELRILDRPIGSEDTGS